MTGIEIPMLSIPKVALVTGGNSGIGRATAARLACMGSAVVVGYNSRRAQAEEVIGCLEGRGHLALRIAIDDPASVSEAAASVDQQYGRLDALINCGGATTPVPANDLQGLTDDIFDRTIAARTGLGSSLAYLAAKAGVDALTIALAKVLAPKIRVFSVSPAGVDTDFVAGRTREHLQKIAEKLPLAHVTTPDDVARAAVACIVSLTSSTGIVVPVDEGRHL
jgi:3-oxoacyl-[acyl-carrier protein] reductase